jgi:peptidoglycan/LPS O-acetylase OafA/YrhL
MKHHNGGSISAFNGLRGLFLLMILACHTNTTTFIIGEQAVDGFLIMSGWLNAMSLDRSLVT